MDVPLEIVLTRLYKSLGVNIFHLLWIPHQWISALRRVSVAECCEVLRGLEVTQRIRLRGIITNEES
jgi:hypothetical protein